MILKLVCKNNRFKSFYGIIEVIREKAIYVKQFETSLEGLYIGGYFRGLMPAMISGKIISEDILKKWGNK